MTFVTELKRTFFVLKNSGVNGWFIKLISTLALIIILLGYFIYRESYQKIQHELMLEADNIDKYLTQLSYKMEKFVQAVGHRIANENLHTVENIEAILHETNNNSLNTGQNIHWTPLLSWVNKDGILDTYWRYGIMSKKYDLSYRSYYAAGKKNPWHLNISLPSYSIHNQNFIIPSGMGITDNKGKFLGIIAWEFDVDSVTIELVKHSKNNIKFLLSDINHGLYLASDKMILKKYQYLPNLNLPKNTTGMISWFFLDDDIYLYQKYSPALQAVIFVGYDKHIFYANLMSSLITIISVCLGVGAMCLLLVCYITSTLINTVNSTESTKLDFMKSIHTRLSNNISIILNNCNTIHYNLIQIAPTALQQKINMHINSIVDYMEYIYDLSLRNIEMVNTSLNHEIEKALETTYQIFMKKNIELQNSLENNLPEILADPLSIKHLIEIIISKIAKDSSYGGKISISTYSEKDTNSDSIVIYLLFQFEGYGVDDKDDNKDQKNWEHIIKLVNFNHGQLSLDRIKKYDNETSNLLIKFTTNKLLITK